jgi:hypothetical protein
MLALSTRRETCSLGTGPARTSRLSWYTGSTIVSLRSVAPADGDIWIGKVFVTGATMKKRLGLRMAAVVFSVCSLPFLSTAQTADNAAHA